MAGKGNNTSAIKRASSHRRGIKPGDKVVNRKGGGTPPSTIVSNPTRIEGIKKAFITEITKILGDDHLMVSRAKFDLNMLNGMELEITPEYTRAVTLAKKLVPDWAKLPAEHRPGLNQIEEAARPRKRQQLKGPFVATTRRTIPAAEAKSQMQRTFDEQQTLNKQPTATPARPRQSSARSLPTNRDLDAMKRVAQATRPSSTTS